MLIKTNWVYLQHKLKIKYKDKKDVHVLMEQ